MGAARRLSAAQEVSKQPCPQSTLHRLRSPTCIAQISLHSAGPQPPSHPANRHPICALCRLSLHSLNLRSQLPDMQPGALPRLQDLVLSATSLRMTMPASWGSRPDVLPALQMMTLKACFVGKLPSEWAQGFRQLTSLTLAAQEDEPGGTQTAGVPSLPAAWAAGFPALTRLKVSVRVAGSVPTEWLEGGFPELSTL